MRRRALHKILIGLLLAFILPLLAAAYFVYRGHWPGSQMNQGHLFHPAVSMKTLPWKTVDGAAFLWKNNEQNKWLMVYRVPPHCDEHCKQAIYHLHQIQVALNKDQDQFQRILLFVESASSQQIKTLMADPYAKGALALRLPSSAFNHLPLADAETILILDPAQWLVLGYTEKSNPSDILKDLQRLMRAFHLGHSKT